MLPKNNSPVYLYLGVVMRNLTNLQIQPFYAEGWRSYLTFYQDFAALKGSSCFLDDLSAGGCLKLENTHYTKIFILWQESILDA